MGHRNRQLHRRALTLILCCIGTTLAIGPAMGTPLQSAEADMYFATSELAQVML